MEFFPSRTIAVELFGFGIHWYGLMYATAFVLAWFLLPKLQRYRGLSMTKGEWENVLAGAILGVIIGGRLGFVLFYEPVYFLENPLKIFAVWEGGMASHGGFIGVTIALLFTLRHRLRDLLRIADVVVIAAALGLMIGRFGNFINQELYGIPTSLPWGISIPGVEGLRHPTPIYSMIQNGLIALLCFLHLRTYQDAPGRTTALFLMLYSIGRFTVEFYRVQDHGFTSFFGFALSRGQLLTIPVFLIGIALWVLASRLQKSMVRS